MKKIINIFAGIVFFVLMQSFTCEEPCQIHEPMIYKYIAITTDNFDNNKEYQIVSETNIIYSKAYGIRLTLYTDIHDSVLGYKKDYCYDFSADDSIRVIKIFTLNDFDSEHPKDSEISEFFRFLDYSEVPEFASNVNRRSVRTYLPIKDYSEIIKQESKTFIRKKIEDDFLLFKSPQNLQNHQFRIDIEFYKGRILSGTTPIVNFIE